MRVLMVSIDKGLLGQGQLGDVVERHKAYGRYVETLDIIVLSKRGYSTYSISENVTAYPTNSFMKLNYYFDAKRIAQALFEKRKYDVVVAQDPFITGLVGMRLKRKFGIPLLVHIHGDFFGNSHWRKEKWNNIFLLKLGEKIIKETDGIRVMSSGQKEKLLRLGIADEKIEVISTPIDLQRYSVYHNENVFRALREMIKVHGIKKIVLMVGRKDPVKDFDTLFKAMTIVMQKKSDVGLWLVGNYSESERDSGIIPLPNAKRRVLISEKVDSVNLPAYYKLSDIVVLSSTSESFGKVLVEANACGKPVVSTATTGAKEIICDDENGFLVPIRDSKALAEKILWLLDNPDMARRMGEKGKTMAFVRFDGSTNTKKIIAFWDKLARAKQGRKRV